MKKLRYYLIIITCYFLFAALYFGGDAILAQKGLEYRVWVDLSAHIFIWCIPFLLVGMLLWNGIKALLLQGKKVVSGLLLGCFVLFIVFSTLAAVYMLFFTALKMETEARMPDGNLVVAVPTEYAERDLYYAKPVGILARKKFSWDSEHYAKSLSKIYDTEFTAVQDERLGTVYHSEDYPGLDVQVWGVGYEESDYLRENLRQLATSNELDKKGKKFFQNAAELTEYEVEAGWNFERESKYTVTALTVYWKQMNEAAEKIALFIREELLEAHRADGKNLWDDMTGTIFVTLKFSPNDKKSHNFNISFRNEPGNFWVYGEDVTADEIEECLAREFSTYRNSRGSDLQEEADEASKGTDSAAEPDKEVQEPYMQSDYHRINDGFVAIYAYELSDTDGSRFLTDEDAKGNQEAIIYEDEQVVRFLRFDRESQNGKCLLYVYYEADKNEDGSYSPTEARILDMFAYVIDTGEVIASGKTAWSDVGTKEYREATGE